MITYTDKFESIGYINSLSDITVYIGDNFILLGRYEDRLCSSRYSKEREMFTDGKQQFTLAETNSPLTVMHEDKLYLIDFRFGKVYVEELNMDNILNDYTVGNKNIYNNLEAVSGDATAVFFLTGETNPRWILKINDIIRDITPLDNEGNVIHSSCRIDSMTITEENMLQFIYEGECIYEIDITDWLSYAWDKEEIINK